MGDIHLSPHQELQDEYLKSVQSSFQVKLSNFDVTKIAT